MLSTWCGRQEHKFLAAMAMAMTMPTAAATATAPRTAIAVLAPSTASRPQPPLLPFCANLSSFHNQPAPWRLHSRRQPMASNRKFNALLSSGNARRATAVASADAQAQADTTTVTVKEFLQDLKPVGRVSAIYFRPPLVTLSLARRRTADILVVKLMDCAISNELIVKNLYLVLP